MPPRSPVRTVESKKDRAQRKDRIRKSNKRRESTVKDKAHHSALYRVHIQKLLYKHQSRQDHTLLH